MLHNDGNEAINSLTLYSFFPDKILKLNPEVPLFDAVEKQSRRCYSFNIKKNEKKEKLIIQTTMYSGNMLLVIDGWKLIERDIIPIQEGKYRHRILSEQFTILEENDFNTFDENNPEFKDKDSTLNFCYYSLPESSYSLNIYFLSKIENIQSHDKANILTPSSKIRKK